MLDGDLPRAGPCPRCASNDVERHSLQRTGTLWTWTVQTFPPKGYAGDVDAFEPFGVGYVDAGAELIHLAETGSASTANGTPCCARALEIDGRLPVNTDGGCIANGEPVGASGLRQVHEIVLQLRGDAGARQVPGEPSSLFTQVYGASGVSPCTVLSR